MKFTFAIALVAIYALTTSAMAVPRSDNSITVDGNNHEGGASGIVSTGKCCVDFSLLLC